MAKKTVNEAEKEFNQLVNRISLEERKQSKEFHLFVRTFFSLLLMKLL